MIDFPSEFTDKIFNERLARGTVILTKIPLHDGSEDYKRLIVVSLDCSNPTTPSHVL